ISDLYFAVNVQSISVTPFTLAKGAGIGLLASVFAAALPAYAATRTAPTGAMRRSDQEQNARKLVPYITGLAILMSLGGMLILSIPTESVELSFAGLFAIVVGGAFFTPIALIAVMGIMTPIM